MAERQFGPYRLVHQIATGGMAEIHLAKTRGIGGFEKYIALKMIHPNFSSDEHFIEMLIDEAKISVALQHVNIAQIFDLGRVGDTYYIAMEYVDGSDLYKVLRKASEQDVPMPIEVAAFVAKEVCAGLDYAHRKRDGEGNSLLIVHRDVSPQNVLLSHAGEVKIVDFGIAKATSRVRQTAVGVIKGKYYYMSPEQAWGDPVDHRTDIFSTGILLYEMLTGQMLYLEEDLHKLLDMVRKAEIPQPSRKRKEIPPELDKIVMKALAKRPEHRWQSAHDFGTALEKFIHSHAPDMSPSKLGGFIDRVLAEVTPPPVSIPLEPPTAKAGGPLPKAGKGAAAARPASPRPPGRVTQGIVREAIMSRDEFTDENSVIFKMSDVARGPSERGPAGSSGRGATGARNPNHTSETLPARGPSPPPPRRATPQPDRSAVPRPANAKADATRPARGAVMPKPRPPSRMPNAATPHMQVPEENEDATQISEPPAFEADFEPDYDQSEPLADDPALDSVDLPWDERGASDFSTLQPTRAATQKARQQTPPQVEPSIDDDEETGARHRAPTPRPGDGEGDDDELKPTARLQGVGPLPPALSGRNPTPAVSAIAPRRPSRRTPMAVPILHAPRPDTPLPVLPPISMSSAPSAQTTSVQQPGEAAQPPRSRPPTVPPPVADEVGAGGPDPAPPVGGAARARSRPPIVGAPPSGPMKLGDAGGLPLIPPPPSGPVSHELPLTPPRDTPPPFPAIGAQPQQPAPAPFQPPLTAVPTPLPMPVPLWTTEDAGFALPDIEDPAYRLPSVKPDRRRLWMLIGGAVILLGVGALIFALASRAPSAPVVGSLEVISLPAGATLEVDGRRLGTTPTVVDDVPIGSTVKLRLLLDKHDVWERSERVDTAARVKVIAQLKAVRGTLKVDSTPPGAEVLLDNRSIGTTPLERTDLDPFVDGVVEVRRQGYRPKREKLVWAGQRTASLSFELEPAK